VETTERRQAQIAAIYISIARERTGLSFGQADFAFGKAGKEPSLDEISTEAFVSD
jgi:hypothetical protein